MEKNEIKNHLDVLRRTIQNPFKRERRHTVSFRHARDGIIFAFQTQPNFLVHVFFALLATFMGFYFHIGKLEWVVIGFSIMTVLVAETINTAIEQVVDLLTDKYHLNAKHAKDVAAGMVLIAATFAVVIGFIIFVPYLLEWTKTLPVLL